MPYVQLTSEERYVIYHLKLYGLSLREIGRRLDRHHTTISRELQRNGPAVPTWVYWHEGAHNRRCNAENSRATIAGMPINRWYVMSNSVYVHRNQWGINGVRLA